VVEVVDWSKAGAYKGKRISYDDRQAACVPTIDNVMLTEEANML